MSRLSLVKKLTNGVLRSRRLALGCRPLVRYLSDDSNSSLQQVENKLKQAEMEKPSAQTKNRLTWPDFHGNEFNEGTHDAFPATWDCKNNELDVEQLAGLPSPNEANDPYLSSGHEPETGKEDEEHQKFLEELQFGRMLALRGQLNRELCSPESFTNDERSSLASVRENVDFMMQELSQISFMLRTLYPQQDNTNSMGQKDCVLESAYSGPPVGSWVYTHPSVRPKQAYADVSNVEKVVQEFQKALPSPVATTASEEQLSPAQDEVITADNSSKNTPMKPSQSTPSTSPNLNPHPHPSKDARQAPQPQETIPTYKPFRTIDVPAPDPSQSPRSEVNVEQVPKQDETAVEERAENSPMKEGFIFSTQLSEAESRCLMEMALKQALNDLESGRTNYKATLLMADDGESHGVD